MDNIFAKRVECWKNTQTYNINTADSIKVFHYPKELKKRFSKSNVEIFDEDSIDCGLRFKNSLVLNLADDIFAGGCVDIGSGAQEESLFRRTTLFKTLKQSFYPIKDDEAIYSPNVTVIKDSEHNNWKVYKEFKTLSFVACPGLKYPTRINNRLSDTDVNRLKKKIEIIIQTAYYFKHDTIIFGAIGCGAWRNPIEHVAEIFKEVLDKYSGVVLNYYFAILTMKDNYVVKHNIEDTINIFKNVLKK